MNLFEQQYSCHMTSRWAASGWRPQSARVRCAGGVGGARLAGALLLLLLLLHLSGQVCAGQPKTWFKLKERVRSDRFNNWPIRGRYRNNETREYYQSSRRAQITKASHFESKYVLGQKIVFICVATGEPIPTIHWKKDGQEINMHKFLKLSEWQIDEYTLKSKMEIDPASQMDKGIYQCFADNMFAIDIKAFRTSYSSG